LLLGYYGEGGVLISLIFPTEPERRDMVMTRAEYKRWLAELREAMALSGTFAAPPSPPICVIGEVWGNHTGYRDMVSRIHLRRIRWPVDPATGERRRDHWQ